MCVGVRVSAGRITAGDVATLGISTVLRTSIININQSPPRPPSRTYYGAPPPPSDVA